MVPDLTQASSSHEKLFPPTDLLIRLFHFLGKIDEEWVLVKIYTKNTNQNTEALSTVYTMLTRPARCTNTQKASRILN